MSTNALIAPLMRVRIFQGLSQDQLDSIARRAERIVYRTHDIITEAGIDADAAVLIVAGPTVRLVPNAAGETEAIEAGSLIGEMAMFIDHVYGSTVRAAGPVRALRLPRAAMLDLMNDDRKLADHLVAKIASRLTGVAAELRRIDESLQFPAQAAPRAIAHMPALTSDFAAPALAHH
jgi:CRP-like cAMP-binding protein